jgi:hypothetical protein
MPDLKTQMGDYFEHVVERVTVEDILQERVDARLTQPVRGRTVARGMPGWLYGLTAAVVILFLGFIGWVAVDNGDVEERQTASTHVTSSSVDPNAIASQTVDGVSFSFVIPAQGWELFDGVFMSKSTQGPQGAEAIIYWARFPEGALASACASVDIWPPPYSAAGLAAAVASVPGIELISGPSDVTVGGLPAKHVALVVREDTGCDPGFFFNWRAQMGGAIWDRTYLGDTINVWIVDVDGTRLFIAGATHPDALSYVAEEIEQIIESIRFD